MTKNYRTLNSAIELVKRNYHTDRRKLYLADGAPKYAPEAMEAEQARASRTNTLTSCPR
jgi:hypothetical protein